MCCTGVVLVKLLYVVLQSKVWCSVVPLGVDVRAGGYCGDLSQIGTRHTRKMINLLVRCINQNTANTVFN